MSTKRRIVIAGWIVIAGTVSLGALGYLQELFSRPISHAYTWILLASFLLLSLAEILLVRQKEQHAAEEFYEDELRETYPRGASEHRMHFFNERGKQCVALTLTHPAIPNSVQLWEGGYVAPAFTFIVKDNVVIFLNSAFTSHADYKDPGPIYSVRYYPVASKAQFRTQRS